jgi:hypothetical protein
VELHSNKAERRRFLDQLDASWKKRGKKSISDWVTITEQVRVRRDQLNAYAVAVHTPDANGWTAYRAMGECVRGREVYTPTLKWSTSYSSQHDRATYDELEATVTELATVFSAVPAHAALARVQAAEWSMAWETGLLESCQQLQTAAESLAAAIQRFASSFAFPLSDVSATQLTKLFRFASELGRPNLPSAEILLHGRLSTLTAALNERRQLLRKSDEANLALEQTLGRSARCHPEPTSLFR